MLVKKKSHDRPFNSVLQQLRDGQYRGIKFSQSGIYYIYDELKNAIKEITGNNKIESFERQLCNYGFYAQEHSGNQKYKYRTFPNKDGFPYKLLTIEEKKQLARTCKSTKFKISKVNDNVQDNDTVIDDDNDDDWSVIDETGF